MSTAPEPGDAVITAEMLAQVSFSPSIRGVDRDRRIPGIGQTRVLGGGAMVESIVQAQRVRKTFGKQHVLDDIDLEVKRGSVLALLGPNGAGKTTTVRILTTLLKPD